MKRWMVYVTYSGCLTNQGYSHCIMSSMFMGLGGNQSTQRKPMQSRGEDANFTQCRATASTTMFFLSVPHHALWNLPGTTIQLRYESVWTNVVGQKYNTPLEIYLHSGERIVQVSGKHSHYIYQLIFVTSKGHHFICGQPGQISFNFYQDFQDAELRLLSGRFNGNGITELGAHWGVTNSPISSTNASFT
ncbi:zymogen granule membrane protein 16-like isoform X2 [Syngnathoides biaculeatus]|uniref:zymogen granule membrane protein 16-like isoform X2 n=1 Tax=Syngnathoides biaculeatus TaxID=300417 RepID=UPI002ADE5716|nr:zymogen granule membrane protein 16-like isoform X2 [Syngnathoides biaculeatus]